MEPIIRRSCLILPAHSKRFVDKAYTRGADAYCLDLEDSVAPHQKAEARACLREAIPSVARSGADIAVRVNNDWNLLFDDLDAAVVPGVHCIKVPKVESAAEVHAIDRLIEDRERRQGMPVGSVHMAVALESAHALLHDEEIASASPRIRFISSASEDFATDMEIELTDDGWELFWGKARLVLVARVHNIEALGMIGRVSDYTDLETFRQSALRGKRLGFRGANCIHPAQVKVLNEVFTPSAAEIARAQRIVDEGRKAEALGQGAFGVGGQMADIPTVQRAERLLKRAALIAERERRAARAA